MLTVDVWSDLTCPWCFVGSRNLRTAVTSSALDVEITWHAFQLRPDLPPGGRPYRPVFEETFGSGAAFDEAELRVGEVAAAAGVELRFDRISLAVNTRRAHRLVVAAQALRATGEQVDVDGLVDALFRAYFVDGANLGDDAELARIGAGFGVGRTSADVLAAIDEPGTDFVVDDDQATAASLGITGVPAFICGGLGVIGAQPPSSLARLLTRAAAAG